VLDGRDDFLKGRLILINKPINWTSFQVVKKIRFLIKKRYKLKKIKVGHAGTLDPLATGLLILCTGKLTKKIADIQAENKKYRGTITLGGSTPSYDLETEINTNYQTSHITENLIFNASNSFIGEINQKPPIFSALKKNGERMYEKARRGEKVVIKSRKVKIHEFNITSINNLTVNFEITCSKGTYIRSIANDFGVKLNTGGYLSSLKRISIGDYNLSESTTIEDFEKQLFN
jgi:tRNA pseudouridine55 synthase